MKEECNRRKCKLANELFGKALKRASHLRMASFCSQVHALHCKSSGHRLGGSIIAGDLLTYS